MAHYDACIAALRNYFSRLNPDHKKTLIGFTAEEISDDLSARIRELNTQCCLILLAEVEAAFMTDFDYRVKIRLKDAVSRKFRQISRRKTGRVRFDEDVLGGWYQEDFHRAEIKALRGALNFRHWVAHGRYWPPRLGQTYDLTTIHLIADTIFREFPFKR